MTSSDSLDSFKSCPMCAEHIQSEALLCRYCGYDYRYKRVRSSGGKTNGFAIASLVLGIVWVYWIGSVLALVFGIIALNQIKKAPEPQQGKGMAIAGIVLGGIGVAMLVLFVIVIVAAESSVYPSLG